MSALVVVVGLQWGRETRIQSATRLVAESGGSKGSNSLGHLKAVRDEFKPSQDPREVDLSQAASMRLAYDAGKRGDYKSAREEFLAISNSGSKGNAYSSTYGSIPDQAAYQAAVCLAADGQSEAAKKEFRTFIQERPHSPLIHACYRRLVRMNGGVSDPKDEALLQESVNVHQDRQQKLLASCDPKAIQKALYLNLGKVISLDQLMNDCGTTMKGSSMKDVLLTLRKYGADYEGYELNARDFANVRTPALWLKDDHFVVIEKVQNGLCFIFDPMTSSSRTERAPDPTKGKFSAFILAPKTTQIGAKP